MSSRLIASTVVGQNKRKIHRMFICIREKVPLMLGLIMDFVGTIANAAKLSKRVRETSSGKGRALHTCFGESSVEEIEDDCSCGQGLSVPWGKSQ